MKKGVLVSLVRNILSGGMIDQNEASLHDEVISAYATACITELMYSLEESEHGPFLKHYPSLEIKTDEVRAERYVEVPEPLTQIPGNIKSISPDQDRKSPWPIVNAGELSIYCNLDISTCLPMAYHEGGRIYISGGSSNIKTAMLVALPSIAMLNDEDDVPIPRGMEKTLVDSVIERFAQEVAMPEDNINDNASAR